jgi:tetratricopeptide (TPR) repeat protein
LTDPIFRAAVSDDLIKNPNDDFKLPAAVAACSKLHAEYLLVVSAYRENGQAYARAILYRNGKQIWKDPVQPSMIVDPSKSPTDPADLQPETTVIKPNSKKQRQNIPTKTVSPTMKKIDFVLVGVHGPRGLDIAETSRSQGRTWTEMLAAGPLKGLAPHTRVATPEPAQGQAPIDTGTAPKVVDNKALQANVAALNKDGRTAQAISVLRDAVDAEPMDLERRTMLINALLATHQSELAAREARRAAELMPDKIALRAMAARAWLQVGNKDEAQLDLNEAVARDPDSVETRTLLAELCLAQNKAQNALEHLDKAVAQKPTGDVLFKRALAKALLGDDKGASEDLAKAKEAGLGSDPSEAIARYGFAVEVFDTAVKSAGDDLRSLFARALVRRSEPEVEALANDQAKLIASRSVFLSALVPPAGHKQSHERRILAHNLLAQSVIDLQSFIKSGDEDTLADARINLGEALKQLTSARAAYTAEADGTVKHAGDSKT